MKSLLFLLSVWALSWPVYPQDVNIYSEKTEHGFILFADNEEYCPVSVDLSLKLKNLAPASDIQRIFVVPPRTNRHLLAVLEIRDPYKESGYSSYNRACLGDLETVSPDEGHAYYLPFRQGESYLVSQGYNGHFSHKGINAIDFAMPVGTEIYAARDGIVVKVVEHHNRNCLQKNCAEYNNLILIYHSDGTFGDYAHLKKNGALVREGDYVDAGQLIGYSGNTGYSSNPHLHFEVFVQRMDERESIRTLFFTGNGDGSEYLEEGREYSRQ